MQKFAGVLKQGRDIIDTADPPPSSSFYVMHMRRLKQLYHAWIEQIPLVRPYYAIKCNHDEGLLHTLATLGCGFDCASPSEIESALKHTGEHDILFANPAKSIKHIEYAKSRGVKVTTFDSVCELEKLKHHYPEAACLLRLVVINPHAKCQLGEKYGATLEESHLLLQKAHELRMDVCGVAFHIGSGGTTYDSLSTAMRQARTVMEEGQRLGFDMRMVDIGGGFTPDDVAPVTLTSMATSINSSIQETFPNSTFSGRPIKLVAEPGRYFAESTTTLFTPIYSRRDRNHCQELWIMESLYGAFNCMIYDHSTPTVCIAAAATTTDTEKQLVPTTIWGSTCDSFDRVYKSIELPRLDVGDWLAFPNMGAYTLSGACDFNGLPFTRPIVYRTDT